MRTPLLYEQTDIPEGMTIREWRALRRPCPRRRRFARIVAHGLRTGWRA
jgi:hypothetical protein